jgi:hypothetical protein
MSDPRRSSKRKRRKAVPVLGAAGLSLSLASGASATPAPVVPEWNTAGRNKIILADEEISDVSLATFHVFDSENDSPLRLGIKVAAGHGGCGGCGGHGGGCGCAHAGGCGCAHAGGCGCAHAGGCGCAARVGGCAGHGCGCAGHGCRCAGRCRGCIGGCGCSGLWIGVTCLGCAACVGTCWQWDPYLGRWISVCY